MFDLPDRGFFGRVLGGVGSGISRVMAGRDDPRLSPEENARARSDALVQAGLAALAGGSQGNTSLNVLAQAGLLGQQAGAQSRGMEMAANNQEKMAALAQQGPGALMAMFQQALAVGDHDSARAIAEVLKSMQSGGGSQGYNLQMKTMPILNPETGEYEEMVVGWDPRTGEVPKVYGPAPEDPTASGPRWMPRKETIRRPGSLDKYDLVNMMYDPASNTMYAPPREIMEGAQVKMPEMVGKARGLLTMFTQANMDIEEIMSERGGRGFGRIETFVNNMGLREFVSPQVQRFGSASGVIAEAWLRMTTGAAYNDEEMQTAIRTFIPLPNEPPEVSARKAMYRRRLGAMMSILAGYETPTDLEGLRIYDLPPEVLDLLQKGGQLRQIQHHLSGQIGEALPASAQRRDYEVDETYLTPEERELIRQRREGGG